MTDMPSRHDVFLAIRDGLTRIPTGADHNGVTDAERDHRAAAAARILGDSPYAHPEQPEPPQVTGLKPNPAQGASNATPATPTGSGGSLLERMRANAAKALEAGDGSSAA